MSKNQSQVQVGVNIIAAGTFIKGDIESKGDFRIDGKVEGNITTQGKIFVGETGLIVGNVVCGRSDIAGEFQGTIRVKELLSITEKAKITGEIITGKLQVQPGAVFNGTCKMGAENELGQKQVTQKK